MTHNLLAENMRRASKVHPAVFGFTQISVETTKSAVRMVKFKKTAYYPFNCQIIQSEFSPI